MDKFSTENLILLEFLVDQVSLEHSVKQDLQTMMGETCVSFQFLDNSPLMVSEEDFAPKKKNFGGCDGCSDVKNGKSCLFSLTPEQAHEAMQQFDIYVEVFKKMRCGTLPDKVLIGESLISIVNLFNELVDSSANREDETVAKTLKDCFKIQNLSGELVGYISVYIRMSCFGKLIVTQFQMNLQDNSVEFKAKEGHYLFKYNKKDGSQCPASCPPPAECPLPPRPCPPPRQQHQQHNYMPQQPPCAMPPPCMQNNHAMQMQPPCAMPPQSCPPQPNYNRGGCSPVNSTCMQSCPNYSPPPCPPPSCPPQMNHLNLQTPCNECELPPDDPEADYQEIGACMGGNSLTIRVHKEKKQISECACSDDDDAPRPPAAPQPPFNFKVNGCPQAATNVSITPPTCTAKDGTKITEISDPDKEVFILRIGKKSEGNNKKNNLELELCTPKGKEVKPPPKLETRDTQYEVGDFPAETGKKEKGKGGKEKKGRKAKGGKGKKGKK
ncbi:PREDICTED: uncharacterized protein LOC108560559 [Nicrophorus vespilloides]|uniref:Uncharacterized protein LOC108560559 n=1 Tax=Nicrophorus vespilloides TaxID=110193 RepID=A0ABM1MGF2_NICVS|nr:PREDICTED: uncharacterized protein LOC108560559 [Nicrophorus vespilloides]